MAQFVQATYAKAIQPGWRLGQPGDPDANAWTVEAVATRVADRFVVVTMSHPRSRRDVTSALDGDEIVFRYVG